MAEFHSGDVLAHTRLDGRTQYVRVGMTDPQDVAAGRVYVQDCDGAGFHLDGKGRYLLATTLATRWQIHYCAAEVTR